MTTELARETEKRPLFRLGLTLIFINVVLALLVAWGLLHFGSLGAALSYARGNRLIPDVSTRSFGTLARGTAEKTIVFRLRNYSDQPIQILGAQSTCTCATVASELPMTIPAAMSRPLTIRVRPFKSGWKRETLRVYTNQRQRPELVLEVVGQVLEPNGPAPSAAPPG